MISAVTIGKGWLFCAVTAVSVTVSRFQRCTCVREFDCVTVGFLSNYSFHSCSTVAQELTMSDAITAPQGTEHDTRRLRKRRWQHTNRARRLNLPLLRPSLHLSLRS